MSNPVNPSERLALDVEQAAALVGLSTRAFREYLLPRCPKFYVGRRILIPRRPFERFVDELARDESDRQEATASDLMSRIGNLSKS